MNWDGKVTGLRFFFSFSAVFRGRRKALRKRDQLRIEETQRGACVFEMGVRIREVVLRVGEGGWHRNDAAPDLLAAGVEEAEILEDYPYLEAQDIRACLEYAAAEADHPVLVTR